MYCATELDFGESATDLLWDIETVNDVQINSVIASLTPVPAVIP